MFDKTIQNKRKQRDILFSTNEKIRNRFPSSINFNGRKHISDTFFIFEVSKNKPKMDIPIYYKYKQMFFMKILKGRKILQIEL